MIKIDVSNYWVEDDLKIRYAELKSGYLLLDVFEVGIRPWSKQSDLKNKLNFIFTTKDEMEKYVLSSFN